MLAQHLCRGKLWMNVVLQCHLICKLRVISGINLDLKFDRLHLRTFYTVYPSVCYFLRRCLASKESALYLE